MRQKLEKRAIRTAESKALHTSEKINRHVHIISAEKYAGDGIQSRGNQKTEANRLNSILARTASGNICSYPYHNRILYNLAT